MPMLASDSNINGRTEFPFSLGTQKILIVDDDSMLLEIFYEYLTQLGFEVDCLSDSTKFAQTVSSTSYDVIICDYNMPRFEFRKEIRCIQNLKEAPQVIIITGDPTISTSEEMPFPVLIKPFVFSDLTGILNSFNEKGANKTTAVSYQ